MVIPEFAISHEMDAMLLAWAVGSLDLHAVHYFEEVGEGAGHTT